MKVRFLLSQPTFEQQTQLKLQPDSSGFPEGLLDQPFYGWLELHPIPGVRFNGLTSIGFSQ
jgi:hypothetical protein